MFLILKTVFFISVFSAKVFCAFLAFKKEWISLHSKHFLILSSTFLLILRFQEYRCKSGIAIFAWRVTKSYANTSFNIKKRSNRNNFFEKTHKSSQLFTGVFMKTLTTTTFKSPIPWWTFLELSLTALISPTWQIAMFMSDRYQRWDIRSLHFLVSCLILIYIYVHTQYNQM